MEWISLCRGYTFARALRAQVLVMRSLTSINYGGEYCKVLSPDRSALDDR